MYISGVTDGCSVFTEHNIQWCDYGKLHPTLLHESIIELLTLPQKSQTTQSHPE